MFDRAACAIVFVSDCYLNLYSQEGFGFVSLFFYDVFSSSTALQGHTDSVYSVDFLQPSLASGGAYERQQQPPSRLASCGADQTCIIWTVAPPIRSHRDSYTS